MPGSNVEDGHEMPALHADRKVREGETMAVRRSSRACPGRLLPLLVAVSLGLASPALADDAAPVPTADPAASSPVAVPPGASPIVAPAPGQAAPGPVAIGPPVVAKPAPPVLPVAAPPEKAGDRADAIARDVVLHPPQKQMPEPAASSLRTMKLRLGGLLDRSVHGPEDTEVGRVIDVLLGEDGKPAALEMDVGGFMGVGNRKIVVAWALFDIPKPASTDPIRLSLTDAQVKSAPSAEESGEVTIVTGVIPHVPAATSVPPAKPDVPVVPVPATPALPASALPPLPDPVAPGPVVPGPVVEDPVVPGPAPAMPGTATHPPGGQP
ncbi:MAG: hypothetical protein ACRYGI_08235 [Janthinobacterium lividum]